MAVPTSFISDTRVDYSNEKSNYSLPIITLTAANLVAQTAVISDFFDSVDAISLMVPVKEDVIQHRDSTPGSVATDVHAQRENKWLVRYHGNVSLKKFSVEIPGADLTKLASHSDFADMTDSDVISFVTNFELLVRSPDDGSENVTVDSLEFVGRRL
jgi:hypothetical protein